LKMKSCKIQILELVLDKIEGGIARGRPCTFVLVVPWRKMALDRALHGRRPSGLVGEGRERGKGRGEGQGAQLLGGGRGEGHQGASARGARGLLLGLVFAALREEESKKEKREKKRREGKKKRKKWEKFPNLETSGKNKR
jgi:hypothetical protein